MTNVFIYLCTNKNNQILALRGVGCSGKSCFDLYSAISYEGKKNYAGHFLFHKMCERLKAMNIEFYDLGGTDPKRNKSVFDFKKGTGARQIYYGDEKFIGNFFVKLLFQLMCWLKFYVYRPS